MPHYIFAMQLALATAHAPSPSRANATHAIHGWGNVYVAGDTTLLARPAVAIIGSRHASNEGRNAAATIATDLAHAGIVVLSGLAAGIDGVAHEATLAAGGRTIAVIGTSLDKAYPKEHTALQARIATEHLVVSPFESGTPTAAWRFPKRNRLMARLAQATILIEASSKSGTRHQVDECASLGRPIFAPAYLLEQLEWLNTPSVRRHVHTWREPTEVVAALAEHLALL
jgi:DNA processing protein